QQLSVSVSGASGQWQSANDSAFSDIVTNWTSSAGTILPGQYIRVRGTSASSHLAVATVTLTLGGVANNTFNLTTRDWISVLLTSGTSWVVPTGFSALENTIEGIGGGGGGGRANTQGGAGGGGG